jgi:AcrR family transcriptional regulator
MTDLARAADVSPPTVKRFERGGEVRVDLVEAIQRALEKAGIIFIDANDGGPGVRLRKARLGRLSWRRPHGGAAREGRFYIVETTSRAISYPAKIAVPKPAATRRTINAAVTA